MLLNKHLGSHVTDPVDSSSESSASLVEIDVEKELKVDLDIFQAKEKKPDFFGLRFDKKVKLKRKVKRKKRKTSTEDIAEILLKRIMNEEEDDLREE
mmetsp:Transcript_26258/g.19713  ORF Transcript_26258/g.19713 Transcript_26258/m.19713 type:complete len:97 (+) Transcript_26258:192-482(+)